MLTIILAIFLLVSVFTDIFRITDYIKTNAYQWWYTPCFALFYVVLLLGAYYYVGLPDTILLSWLPGDYLVESFFCVACMFVWFLLRLFLRSPKVFNPMLAIYRKIFAGKEDANNNRPFPYYYSSESKTIKSRVGLYFYRNTLKFVIVLFTLIYSIALIVTYFYPNVFFPKSAFGLLALIPLVEYFIYLCANVKEEQDIIENNGESFGSIGDFDSLWQLFVDIFENYSVAWKHEYCLSDNTRSIYDGNNAVSFEKLYEDFKNKHCGGVIEDCDLLTAFSNLVPFFMRIIKEGRNILVVLDVPNHFSSTKKNGYIELIATQLESTLVKKFPQINDIIKFKVYGEESTLGVFDNNVVVTSLPVLVRQDMKDKEWMRNLGLITVVNIFDKGISNLYENRRFSYLLKAINNDYQILVISSQRNWLESSLESTWVTPQEKHFPDGCKMVLYPRSNRQYFIGYNFEDYAERYKKILSASPNEQLYSGSEMLLFPLSSKINDIKKTVTPVHQFELEYTSTLEGNEEIGKITAYKMMYTIPKENIIKKVNAHILPTDDIEESQMFSIIYDNDNNLARSYLKWIHLGSSENFSIVVSKPYMFRDYFNANHHFFIKHPFSAVQPCMCNSRITLAIILLEMLKNGEKDEMEIKHHLIKYYKPEEIKSVPDILKELFSNYFNDDLAKDLRTRIETVFDGSQYYSSVKFRLVHPDRINLPYLKIVTVKDENGNTLFDIIRDLLFQNYYKGQHHSFSGQPYTITDFDPINNILNVVRGNLSNVLFTKPCYQLSIDFTNKTSIRGINKTSVEKSYHKTGVEMAFRLEAYETNVMITPQEWITFDRYEAPKAAGLSKIIEVDHDFTPQRNYSNGKIMKMSLKYLPAYNSRIDDVRKMFQILLYEGLQSLFPHHSQYLIVTSVGDGDSYLPWIFPQFQCNDVLQDGWLSFYFIEDSHIDLGLIGALTHETIRYLMKYVFDYLLWLSEESIFPDGYEEYRVKSKSDKLSFLKYGRQTLPSYFDIDLIINFIRDQFSTDKEDLMLTQQNRQEHNSIVGCCDFCRTMMNNSEMQRLDDGRMRCPSCSEGAVDTDEQFQILCNEVKNAFRTYLGIDLNNIMFTAQMVSAVALHKYHGSVFPITNGYDVRKLVGLAFDTTIDKIYVENGYKADKIYGIIAHEMTHIWEYNNADFIKVRKTNEDWVEGLAVWTDLFLSEKRGVDNIEGLREAWLSRDDEYGRGLRLIMSTCPDDPYGYIRDMATKL